MVLLMMSLGALSVGLMGSGSYVGIFHNGRPRILGWFLFAMGIEVYVGAIIFALGRGA